MSEAIRKETFKTVYGVETIKEVSELFRKDYIKIKNEKDSLDEVFKLFQRYVLSITFLYSITSIKNNLGIFRNIINEEGGIHKETTKSSFYIFNVWGVADKKTKSKITEKETYRKEMTFDVKSEIQRVKTMLEDKTYENQKKSNNQTVEQIRSYYLAYILGLSTGRRFTEILKTVSIRKRGNSYIFNGILKKDKNQKSEIEANLLYLNIDEVKSYLKELRDYINSKLITSKKMTLEVATESDINTIFSKVYNNSVKRITSNKVPNFHELRHYYAIEGVEVFRIDFESDKDVRYRILGHHIKADSTRTYATLK